MQSGPAVPFARLGVTLSHAEAHLIHIAKRELRVAVPLLSSHAVPLRGLRVIRAHAMSEVVHPPEEVLRPRVPLPRLSEN